MMLDYNLIGQRIKARRIERGLTQENIAEHLDISVSYVSRVERAAVKISLETLVRIAVFLDLFPAFLIDGTITAAGDYMQRELSEAVDGFNADQMGLLLDIAHSMKKRVRLYKMGD